MKPTKGKVKESFKKVKEDMAKGGNVREFELRLKALRAAIKAERQSARKVGGLK